MIPYYLVYICKNFIDKKKTKKQNKTKGVQPQYKGRIQKAMPKDNKGKNTHTHTHTHRNPNKFKIQNEIEPKSTHKKACKMKLQL